MGFILSGSFTSVKGNVAGVLREEILKGTLNPGERIIEGKWAGKLGVAQASVREALNLLMQEGFVQKESGRSARVTSLSEEDVAQIYEMRSSLEGLAARLVTARRPDLTELDQALADMHSAVLCGNMKSWCERDLSFHLLLCEKSGNRFLLENVRRLIVPLFAFMAVRQQSIMGNPELWHSGYDEHKRILEVLRSGDSYLAQREVEGIIHQFTTGYSAHWVKAQERARK